VANAPSLAHGRQRTLWTFRIRALAKDGRVSLKPVFGVAYTEVCYSAYVKTSRCVTLRPGLRPETMSEPILGDGTFHVHRPRGRGDGS